jgi:hypothetical protein
MGEYYSSAADSYPDTDRNAFPESYPIFDIGTLIRPIDNPGRITIGNVRIPDPKSERHQLVARSVPADQSPACDSGSKGCNGGENLSRLSTLR